LIDSGFSGGLYCRFLWFVAWRIRWTRDHCPPEWWVGRKAPPPIL